MFDAGAIVASLDILTDDASRKLDDVERRLARLEQDPHRVKIVAVFDSADLGNARRQFSNLDNAISRDAAQRLRSGGAGSILGALNALFSSNQSAGSVGGQAGQAARNGVLGRLIHGGQGGGTGLLGGLFGGRNAQAAEKSAADQAAAAISTSIFRRIALGSIGQFGSVKGQNVLSGILGGAGPGILGISGRAAGMAGLGGIGLGALPALLAPLAALGVGGAGIGVLMMAAKSLIGTRNVQGRAPTQGPLFGVAQQAGQSVTAVLHASMQPVLGPLRDALKDIPGLIRSISPALRGLFAGAATLINPLLHGVATLARDVLPGLGQAFRAVAPLLGPLIGGLGGLIKGILPGLVTLLRAAAPAVKVFAGLLVGLGKGAGEMFRTFAPVIKQSSVILKALSEIIVSILPVVGKIVAVFARGLSPVMGDFGKLVKSLLPILVIIAKVVADLAGAVIADLTPAFKAIFILFRTIEPSLKVLGNALGTVFKSLENTGVFAVLANALEGLAHPLGLLINELVIKLVPILMPLIKLISEVAGIIVDLADKTLIQLIPVLIKLVEEVLRPLLPEVNALVPSIIRLTQILSDVLAFAIRDVVIPVLSFLVKIIGYVADVQTFMGQRALWLEQNWMKVWDGIKHVAEDAWNFLTHGWGQLLLPGLTAIRDAVKFLSDHWSQIWGDMKTVAQDFWQFVWTDFGAKIMNFFTHTLPSAFRTAVSAIGQAWQDIESVIEGPVNWVITNVINNGLIAAFDWISKRVGGPIIPPVGTISGSGGGSSLGMRTGGRVPGGYGGGDRVLVRAEPGEAFVSKETSSRYAHVLGAMGVPGFQKGGLITKGLDILKIMAALATGNATALDHAFLSLFSISSGGAGGDLGSLLTDIPLRLVSEAVHFMIGQGLGGGGGVPGNVNSYRGLVLRVLGMLGQPAGDLGVVLRQMNTESGGNPTIVNKWDSNWLAGHPSVGLMQVIRGTFDAFAGPFRGTGPFEYGVSVNPLANIFAGLNYAIHRYGGGWTSVLGQGHGYDQGGWLMPGLSVNATRRPEAVLTHRQSSAFIEMAEAARMAAQGRMGGSMLRDLYLMMPEGTSVAQAMTELNFRLQVAAQQGFAGMMPGG